MSDLVIRNMTRADLDRLIGWAATEGWNPGLHDATLFWATDPDAFIAAELDGELIGAGAITSYGGAFGFMGFFIVRPAFRGRGLGNALWHARRDRLIARLRPGATIGLDGVFSMQDYYARGGFVFSHRNLRFRAEVPDSPPHSPEPSRSDDAIVPLDEVPFDDVLAYDRTCFPAAREAFLCGWNRQEDGLALGCLRQGPAGRIRRGAPVRGRLQARADDANAAEALYARLAAFASGGPLFLDVPENHPAAMALAHRHGMAEVFGCARMYLGPAPGLMHKRIFGITTFELG